MRKTIDELNFSQRIEPSSTTVGLDSPLYGLDLKKNA